jgi:hypothetical protein
VEDVVGKMVGDGTAMGRMVMGGWCWGCYA